MEKKETHEKYYNTGDTAKLLGITPKTLRTWDKDNIFKPDRMEENCRKYSKTQIENKTGKKMHQLEDAILSLTPDTFEDISALCEHEITADFNTLLGDTIKERFNALYIKLAYECNASFRRTDFSPNFMLTSPEMASIFETASAGFAPVPYEDNYHQFKTIIHCGIIGGRWKLYKTGLLQPYEGIIGTVGFRGIEEESLFRFKVANFII